MLHKISDAEDKHMNSYPIIQNQCIKIRINKIVMDDQRRELSLNGHQCTKKEEGVSGTQVIHIIENKTFLS